jgi:hypothetical protein
VPNRRLQSLGVRPVGRPSARVSLAGTALGCLLYNVVASFTGGIAVEVAREAPPAPAPALQGWGQPQP